MSDGNTDRLKLKPAPVLDAEGKPTEQLHQVRDPITGNHLAAEGDEKPNNRYWRTRLAEGSVIDMDAKAKAAAQQKAVVEAEKKAAARTKASAPKTTDKEA